MSNINKPSTITYQSAVTVVCSQASCNLIIIATKEKCDTIYTKWEFDFCCFDGDKELIEDIVMFLHSRKKKPLHIDSLNPPRDSYRNNVITHRSCLLILPWGRGLAKQDFGQISLSQKNGAAGKRL